MSRSFINIITVDITSRASLGTILIYSLAIIGVTAISGVGQFTYSYLTQTTGNKVIYDIRQDLFRSMQSKSFSFYDKNQVGDLIARATGDVEAVRRFVTQSMGQLLFTAALLVGVVIELVELNPLLLLPGIGLMPLVVLTGYLFDRQQSPNWKQVRDQYAVMNTVIEENLTGMRVVRAFTREDYEVEKFDAINRKYYDTNIAVARTRAFFIPFMPLLIGLNIAVLFYFGGIFVMRGLVSIGDLVEAYSILVIITPNARFLGLTLSQALNASWGLDRIFTTIDTASEIRDSPDAVEMKEVKGEVVFENVSFRVREGQAAAEGRKHHHTRRGDGSDSRQDGFGEEHLREPHTAVLRRHLREGHDRRGGREEDQDTVPQEAYRDRIPGDVPLLEVDQGQHRLRHEERHRGGRGAVRQASPVRTSSSDHSRRATTR